MHGGDCLHHANPEKWKNRLSSGFFPADIRNSFVQTKSIYRPFKYVSGDVYDYRWHNNILYVYIADIMGHGLATALQASAFRVLFGRVLESESPLDAKLRWLNDMATNCLGEDSFASAILVSLDFNHQVMSYASAGIHHLIIGRDENYKLITVPGINLGLFKDVSFEVHRVVLSPGDNVVLLSDGLKELLPSKLELPASFEQMHVFLDELASSAKQRDDATAICLSIS